MGSFLTPIVLLHLTVLIGALLCLAFASTRMLRALNGLSFYWRLPRFFLSFVVIGLGTSIPDLSVAAISSARGEFPLMLGAIIGSNIVLLCVVLGALAFLKGGLQVREKTILENFGWIFFVLVIPFFLLLDNKLTAFEGIILLVVYLMYVYNVTEQEALSNAPGRQSELRLGDEPQSYSRWFAGREALKLVAFLGAIILFANISVDAAMVLSIGMNLPPLLIGFTVVSLGLTLPEAALGLTALREKQEDVIWGDIIGSFITELTLVLGASALFAGDVLFNFAEAATGYGFMAMGFFLIFLFAYSTKRLSSTQGIALMLLYVIFLSLQVDWFLAG
ncbi:MAG: hypothetical protein WC607_03775 [Candidatus Micrarchaeia archaeon]